MTLHSLPSFFLVLAACALLGACSDEATDPAERSGPAEGSGGTVAGSGGTPGDAAGTGGQPFGEKLDRTATELVQSWDLGWNLGNSLDAPSGETAWGNPIVNPTLLQSVADAGFDVVRIPVTWSLHTGEAPDFTVDSAWMDRVEEVVGYALDAELDVIINVHHDGADGFEEVEWLSLNDEEGAVTAAHNAAVEERFVRLWSQIAARFAEHDTRLLFESMNEIHDGYGPPAPEYFTIINDLNQAFVDTIRAGGGNNPLRYLVVPGYNTNIEHTVAGFQLPVDPRADRLILSAHYYDPYTFAIEGSTHTWGANSPSSDSWGQEDHVLSQFDLLESHFVERGLPVILGEYGAVQQDGYEEERRYYMEYVTKAALERSILPIYWDNGGSNSGADGFALFDRTTGAVTRPHIIEAMMRAVSDDGSLAEVAPPSR